MDRAMAWRQAKISAQGSHSFSDLLRQVPDPSHVSKSRPKMRVGQWSGGGFHKVMGGKRRVPDESDRESLFPAANMSGHGKLVISK